MKDEFISTVSHELRTPLTSLRGALGLLAGGALGSRPEKTQQMLEIAISNTDRLIRLVNDILDLERIGSGKAELQLRHVQRRGPAAPRRRPAADAASPKPNIRISFDANGVNVWADPDRILQALNNLISNAIKFSYPGGEIHLTARNLDENEAIIEVSDQGRGIPADKLETDLRALPAGRCLRLPRAGRHRPGPGHLPQHRHAARRPHLGHQQSRPGHDLPLHPAHQTSE